MCDLFCVHQEICVIISMYKILVILKKTCKTFCIMYVVPMSIYAPLFELLMLKTLNDITGKE